MMRTITANRRRQRGSATWAAVAALLVCALAGLAHADEAAPLVIKAGRIVPVAVAPIAPGMVLIRDGKIEAVGATVNIPDGARIIDVAQGVVIPGLVAAFTTLAEPERNTEESVTPELRVADELDVYGRWRRILSGGATTVYLSPPTGRLIPGRGAVAKLSDGAPSARVLKDPAALRIVLGEWPKNPPMLWHPPLPPTTEAPFVAPERQSPTTRAGELALLRQLFGQARSTGPQKGGLPERKLEVLRAAVRGEIVVRVKAERAEDIRNALALADEFSLHVVIEGGREAYALADDLARHKIPVVLTPPVQPATGVAEDLTQTQVSGRAKAENAALLMKAGVKVAIATSDAAIPDLLAVAAWAVGNGAPADTALRAITMDAADILGVADRVGSIEVGKDADLAVLTGDPLGTQTVVQMAISDGRIAYERKPPEQTNAAPIGALRIVRAREILTGSGGAIRDGEIRIRDGRVEAVGPRAEAPPGAEVIDLGDRVIMPGMIDLQSHLGLHWESEQPTLTPLSATSGSPRGARLVSIADAVDPTDQALREALRAGVTSIALAPGDEGLFCGTVAVVKTAGRSIDDMIVERVAALKFSMSGDRDRAARVWQMRDLLGKAERYNQDWAEFDKRWAEFERRYAVKADPDLKEPSRPRRDPELESIRALFRDHLPALVVAYRADEIAAATKVFREEDGLNLVLLGASDAYRLASELKVARVSAALGPAVIQEEHGRETNVAAQLVQAGVPVALQSTGTSGTEFLRVTAAQAVRKGMDRTEALRAITVRPAQFLGLDRRIGCLEPGRDADLVVLSGDPLELTSRVEKVFLNGTIVYDAAAGG